MEDNTQEIQDPSEEGVGGLKSPITSKKGKIIKVNHTNISNDDIQNLKSKGYDTSLFNINRNFKLNQQNAVENTPSESNVGVPGLGKSSFDYDITSATQLEDLNNTRGELQPAWMQLGAGIAKAGVIAGTTFADGIAGTYLGLLNVATNQDAIANSDHPWATALDKFINNPLSQALQQINDKAEEWLPNYYTNQERSNSWYENILNANTLGNDFLKNFGFMAGAMLAATVNAGALSKTLGMKAAKNVFKGAVEQATGTTLKDAKELSKAVKGFANGETSIKDTDLAQSLISKAKDLKSKDFLLWWVGAFTGAAGEGRIEAIGDTKQWFDNYMKRADGERQDAIANIDNRLYSEHPGWFSIQMNEETGTAVPVLTDPRGLQLRDQYLAQLDNRYNSIQKAAAEKGMFMSNQIFGMNLLFLTLDNAFQMGRFISGGYASGVNFKRLVKENLKEAFTPVKEGEEAIKGFTRNTVRINNIRAKALLNPFIEGNEEMAQAAIQESTGHKHSSELNEYFDAQIDPSASKKTESWASSVWEGLKNTYGNSDQWEQGAIGFVTGLMGMPIVTLNRAQSGKFEGKRVIPSISFNSELWEGMRDAKEAQKEADEVVEELNRRVRDPKFSDFYKGITAHNYFQQQKDDSIDRGDPKAFKDADFKQFLSDALLFDKAGSLDDLKDLIDMGQKANEKDIPLLKQLSVDKTSGKSVFDESKSDSEIIDHIHKQATEAKTRLDNYVKISDSMKTLYGNKLDRDHISGLIWTMANMQDQESRFKELLNDQDLRTNISNLLKERKDKLMKSLNKELTKSHATDKEPKTFTNTNTEELLNDIYGSLATGDAEKLFNTYNNNDVLTVFDMLTGNLGRGKKAKIALINNFYKQVTDLRSLFSERNALVEKLNMLSEHPELFTSDFQAKMKEQTETAINTYVHNTADRIIQNTTSKRDFNNLIDQERKDPEMFDRIINELRNSDNAEIREYANNIEDTDRNRESVGSIINSMAHEGLISNEMGMTQSFMSAVDDAVKEGNMKEIIETLRFHGGDTGNKNKLAPEVKVALNILADRLEHLNNTNESLRDSTKSTVSSEKDKPLSGDIIEDEDEDENEDVFGGLTFVKEGEEEEEEEEEEKSKKKKKPEKSKETQQDKEEEEETEQDKEERKEPINEAIKKAPARITKAEIASAEEVLNIIVHDTKKLKSEVINTALSIYKRLKEKYQKAGKDTKAIDDAITILSGATGISTHDSIDDNEETKREERKKPAAKRKKDILDRPGKSTIVGMPHFRNGPTQYTIEGLDEGLLVTYEKKEGGPADTVAALENFGTYDFINNGNLGRMLSKSGSKLTIHLTVDNGMSDKSLVSEKAWKEFKKKNKNIKYKESKIILLTVSKEDLDKAASEGTINKEEYESHLIKDSDENRYMVVGILTPYRGDENGVSAEKFLDLRDSVVNEVDNKTDDFVTSKTQTLDITKDFLYSGRIVRTDRSSDVVYGPITEDMFKNGSYEDKPLLMLWFSSNNVLYSRNVTGLDIVGLNEFNSNTRNGTLWAYTREADGRFYPKAILTRRFGESLSNSPIDRNSTIYKNIKEQLKVILDPDQDLLVRLAAKRKLNTYIHLADDSKLLFKNNIVTVGSRKSINCSSADIDDLVDTVIEQLEDARPRYQVNVQLFGSDESYRNMILDERIMQTDLRTLYNKNAGFDLPISNDSKYEKPAYLLRPKTKEYRIIAGKENKLYTVVKGRVYSAYTKDGEDVEGTNTALLNEISDKYAIMTGQATKVVLGDKYPKTYYIVGTNNNVYLVNEGNKNYSLVTSKTVKDAVIKTSTSKSFNKDTGRKQREVFTYTDAMKVNDEKIEEKRTKLLDVLGLKKEGVKKEDLERSLWKKCDELTQSKKDADKKKFAKIMSIFKDISKLLSKEDIADLSIFARAVIKRYNANVDSSKQVILRNEAKRLREEEKKKEEEEEEEEKEKKDKKKKKEEEKENNKPLSDKTLKNLNVLYRGIPTKELAGSAKESIIKRYANSFGTNTLTDGFMRNFESAVVKLWGELNHWKNLGYDLGKFSTFYEDYDNNIILFMILPEEEEKVDKNLAPPARKTLGKKKIVGGGLSATAASLSPEETANPVLTPQQMTRFAIALNIDKAQEVTIEAIQQALVDKHIPKIPANATGKYLKEVLELIEHCR